MKTPMIRWTLMKSTMEPVSIHHGMRIFLLDFEVLIFRPTSNAYISETQNQNCARSHEKSIRDIPILFVGNFSLVMARGPEPVILKSARFEPPLRCSKIGKFIELSELFFVPFFFRREVSGNRSSTFRACAYYPSKL